MLYQCIWSRFAGSLWLGKWRFPWYTGILLTKKHHSQGKNSIGSTFNGLIRRSNEQERVETSFHRSRSSLKTKRAWLEIRLPLMTRGLMTLSFRLPKTTGSHRDVYCSPENARMNITRFLDCKRSSRLVCREKLEVGACMSRSSFLLTIGWLARRAAPSFTAITVGCNAGESTNARRCIHLNG